MRNVLLVEAHPAERERLAAALERDGFEVLLCSGPSEPDYGCLGARKGRCPLATDGCVVVLDMDLDSESVGEGMAAGDLLGFYLESGHRVVTLSSHPSFVEEDGLLELRRHPEIDELLAAVWWSASPATSGSPVPRGAWSRPGG